MWIRFDFFDREKTGYLYELYNGYNAPIKILKIFFQPKMEKNLISPMKYLPNMVYMDIGGEHYQDIISGKQIKIWALKKHGR